MSSACLLTPDAQLVSALLGRGRGWGLEGLQGKKNFSFWVRGRVERVLLLHPAVIPTALEWRFAGALKKIQLKAELCISLPVSKLLGYPERGLSPCQAIGFQAAYGK